ncbi:GNAT family N-acetyltransferase [Mangrovihabitans endophyticus]|uniref:N-acetyltransferase n=1 Tax=Mangrovihabitans endophyticus TaxID=1751298 RepID=A0A8J3C266_9ACTN|nr:GNAT family N-acetyltransferase [Mangrovihabitans endophyticus]GGL07120.1 N-acetyltransferase [Mangrovihabitans endophyticus]
MTVVRAAQSRDCEAIGALHYWSRATAYAGFLPPEALMFGSPQALGTWWEARFDAERDTHRLAVACQGADVVGFTYVGPAGAESDPERDAELYAIHVAPEHVGSGIGRLLMDDALGALRIIASSAVLWVLAANAAARRFYERCGWAADGTRRDGQIGNVLTPQVRYRRALI